MTLPMNNSNCSRLLKIVGRGALRVRVVFVSLTVFID